MEENQIKKASDSTKIKLKKTPNKHFLI